MKAFVVVKYHAEPMAFHFRTPDRRWEGIAHNSPQREAHQGDLTEECSVYFCDDEVTANKLADTLSTKFTQYSWLVAKSQTVLFREPGPLSKATFSDKGLMPA